MNSIKLFLVLSLYYLNQIEDFFQFYNFLKILYNLIKKRKLTRKNQSVLFNTTNEYIK